MEVISIEPGRLAQRGDIENGQLEPSGRVERVMDHFSLAQRDCSRKLLIAIGHFEVSLTGRFMHGMTRRGALLARTAPKINGIAFHTRPPGLPGILPDRLLST
ncbi:MAG TPA: hypothetical protein VFU87_06895 [Sphingomicrobium sp.]|nr:hypothetical protein [Sphingomicrobium sp.]